MQRWRGLSAWGIVLLTLGLLLFGVAMAVQNLGRPRATVTIGATAYRVEVARTDAQLQRGLSGRTDLADGQGMLFVFPNDGPQPMWMKDMRFNLDIIWLNGAKRVVHIEHDLTPDSYPHSYSSPTAARYVLEVPAGSASQNAITLGKTATFDLP